MLAILPRRFASVCKLTFWLFVLLTLLTACSKKDSEGPQEPGPNVTLPQVSTASITDTTLTSAKSGGNVQNDGGADVSARGVVWDIEPSPTLEDSKTED